MAGYLLPYERWFAAKSEAIRRKNATSSPAVAQFDSCYGPDGIRMLAAAMFYTSAHRHER
jgi:hypothetical protein